MEKTARMPISAACSTSACPPDQPPPSPPAQGRDYRNTRTADELLKCVAQSRAFVAESARLLAQSRAVAASLCVRRLVRTLFRATKRLQLSLNLQGEVRGQSLDPKVAGRRPGASKVLLDRQVTRAPDLHTLSMELLRCALSACSNGGDSPWIFSGAAIPSSYGAGCCCRWR